MIGISRRDADSGKPGVGNYITRGCVEAQFVAVVDGFPGSLRQEVGSGGERSGDGQRSHGAIPRRSASAHANLSALLRYKVYEPILVIGPEKLANIDIRLRVKGGGHVSQLYALRQAIAKGVVA